MNILQSVFWIFCNSSFEKSHVHPPFEKTGISSILKTGVSSMGGQKTQPFFQSSWKIAITTLKSFHFFKLFSRLSVAICNIIIQFSNFYELCWHMMENFNLSEFWLFKKILSVCQNCIAPTRIGTVIMHNFCMHIISPSFIHHHHHNAYITTTKALSLWINCIETKSKTCE